MLKRGLVFGIILTFFLFAILILMLINAQDLSNWVTEQWVDILYALIFAVIIGLLFEKLNAKFKPKSTISKKTLQAPQNILAKLILPNKQICIIKDESRTFGRKDFLGSLTTDGLALIGQKHFEITKKDENFYLKDLESKNGTKINGIKVKGKEVKLSDGDQITVADMLDLTFIVLG
jgi:hypothetical protein